MSTEDTTDKVQALILRRAAACIAHARAVEFGAGSANFYVVDGDLRLVVNIHVSSEKPAKE